MPSIGGFLGDTIGKAIGHGVDAVMKALWSAAIALLDGAFQLADMLSVFSVSRSDGPIGAVWPMMLWLSGAIALGLFFMQLTSAALKGGRGMLRVVSGPVEYGVALTVTTGAVAAFLTAADGLTRGILHYALDVSSFHDALNRTGFGDAAIDGVKAVQLGLIALFGVLPSAIGYVLEMLFRQAAILILVATVPITAAGLLSTVTAKWFWRTSRWLLASIAMKPVLALALALGVGVLGGADGLKELLIGQGVLLISLLAPFALFRLFAFVDPNTEAGSVFRHVVSGAGVDSYPGVPDIPSLRSRKSGDDAGGESEGGDGSDALETAHAGRFDDSGGHTGHAGTASSNGHPNRPTSPADDDSTGSTNQPTATEGDDGPKQPTPTPPANRGAVVSSSRTRGPRGDDPGEDPPSAAPDGGGQPPDPDGDPGRGPRGGGPTSGGSGGAAAATEAETAVIV